MNKNNFISVIKNPEQIDLAKIEQLKELTRQFPYCTTAQILLTKGLHNEHDIAFEKQLRISAAYAIDRSVLHHLILERPSHSSTPEAISSIGEEVQPPVDLEQPSIAPSEIKDTIEGVVEMEEVFEADKTNEIELGSEESTVNEEKEEIHPFLEREILSAAIHSTYLLEAEETNEEEKTEVEEKTTLNPASTNENSAHSFGDWLKLMDGQDVVEEKEEAEKIAPKAASKDLVDRFITTSPQIKVKKEFYSASNMARLSVKENDDLVTETLANIYAQQGNTEKAISAYEKLALKYPEKRIYFANLIHKLGIEPKK
tara:strand:- start:1323 stop:2264 length:942 start_codon:yes stop_codon:yes gene_type:complete